MTEIRYSSPEEVEEAFYKAFETANLEAMMSVWLDAEYVECIHPMSPSLIGITVIRDGWQDIFQNGAEIQFETVETRQIKHKDLAIHIVNEYLRIKGNQQIQILATNIYEKTPQGWRMILHHASPAPKQPANKPPPTLH